MPDMKSPLPEVAQSITGLICNLNLETTYVPTGSLVAFGRKTRSHTKAQLEALAKVIAEFGFIVPVIVDESGKVIAGNGRVEAARLAGLSTIPVVRVSHLTNAQKRQFVIADNRLAEQVGHPPPAR
jgi:hypothetical protein